jgi:hypothetical protein
MAACVMLHPLAHGGEGSHTDKSSFNLLNPTPAELMRPISADRPDKTESPYTVDAGHIQLEMDFANLSVSRHSSPDGDVRTRSYEIAPFTFKVGLLNQVDLQTALIPYHHERETVAGQTSTGNQSFQEWTQRLKINLFGNDEGKVAMALIPYVTIPLKRATQGNEAMEGGLICPISFSVAEWDFGVQSAVGMRGSEKPRTHHAEFEHSACASHALFGKLRGAVEFYSSVSTRGDEGWIGTVNTWLTYEVTQNLLVESGVYIGVTPAADDLHPWIGMTVRF